MTIYNFACVNYNNSEITINYIKSIYNLINIKKYNFIIFIIDNNSIIEDYKKIEIFTRNLKKVRLIRNDSNLGYFAGLNVALSNLNINATNFWIIGNNDLQFQNDFLDKLNNINQNDRVLVISPNIITLDNIHQNPHIIRKFNLIKKIYRKIYFSNYYISIILQYFYNKMKYFNGGNDRKDSDRMIPILMGYGACYILTPIFFRHYTNLDAPVFLMGEEGILANQILRIGGITMYHPELIVNHLDHSSISKLPNKTLYKYSQISYRHYLKNCTYISK